MFPIRWNFPFRKKNGALSTIGAEIEEAGSYTLPTASAETKGGVKIGNGLSMEGEVLSANAQLPAYSVEEAGKVLGVTDEGTLAWITVSAGGYTMPKAKASASTFGTITTKGSEVTT